MKKIGYIIIALCCCAFTACMDSGDWDAPSETVAPYGDNSITEHNVITIADLKARYASTLSQQNDTARIREDVQIKARVTGNDIGGNIYNEVALDDGTGGILVCIAQGGLFGYLPVGQEILINLKDLYIGCYGYQVQIGMPYTNNSGRTFPSRMNRMLWQQHFKLLGTADASKVQPEEFDLSRVTDAAYLNSNSGKLMTVKGVQLGEADGTKTFAPEADKDAGNGVSRVIKGYTSRQFVVRSSTYADFANEVMPTGKVNITGIFTRYGSTWQILLRTGADVEEVK